MKERNCENVSKEKNPNNLKESMEDCNHITLNDRHKNNEIDKSKKRHLKNNEDDFSLKKKNKEHTISPIPHITISNEKIRKKSNELEKSSNKKEAQIQPTGKEKGNGNEKENEKDNIKENGKKYESEQINRKENEKQKVKENENKNKKHILSNTKRKRYVSMKKCENESFVKGNGQKNKSVALVKNKQSIKINETFKTNKYSQRNIQNVKKKYVNNKNNDEISIQAVNEEYIKKAKLMKAKQTSRNRESLENSIKKTIENNSKMRILPNNKEHVISKKEMEVKSNSEKKKKKNENKKRDQKEKDPCNVSVSDDDKDNKFKYLNCVEEAGHNNEQCILAKSHSKKKIRSWNSNIRLKEKIQFFINNKIATQTEYKSGKKQNTLSICNQFNLYNHLALLSDMGRLHCYREAMRWTGYDEMEESKPSPLKDNNVNKENIKEKEFVRNQLEKNTNSITYFDLLNKHPLLQSNEKEKEIQQKPSIFFKNYKNCYVYNKRILEIGTGPLCILSINAILNGATHVDALEVNEGAYDMGKKILKGYNLQKFIKIRNCYSKIFNYIDKDCLKKKKKKKKKELTETPNYIFDVSDDSDNDEYCENFNYDLIISEIIGDFASQEGVADIYLDLHKKIYAFKKYQEYIQNSGVLNITLKKSDDKIQTRNNYQKSKEDEKCENSNKELSPKSYQEFWLNEELFNGDEFCNMVVKSIPYSVTTFYCPVKFPYADNIVYRNDEYPERTIISPKNKLLQSVNLNWSNLLLNVSDVEMELAKGDTKAEEPLSQAELQTNKNNKNKTQTKTNLEKNGIEKVSKDVDYWTSPDSTKIYSDEFAVLEYIYLEQNLKNQMIQKRRTIFPIKKDEHFCGFLITIDVEIRKGKHFGTRDGTCDTWYTNVVLLKDEIEVKKNDLIISKTFVDLLNYNHDIIKKRKVSVSRPTYVFYGYILREIKDKEEFDWKNIEIITEKCSRRKETTNINHTLNKKLNKSLEKRSLLFVDEETIFSLDEVEFHKEFLEKKRERRMGRSFYGVNLSQNITVTDFSKNFRTNNKSNEIFLPLQLSTEDMEQNISFNLNNCGNKTEQQEKMSMKTEKKLQNNCRKEKEINAVKNNCKCIDKSESKGNGHNARLNADILQILNNYKLNSKRYSHNLSSKIIFYNNKKYKFLSFYGPVVIDYDEQATVIYKKEGIYEDMENDVDNFVNNVYR